MSFQHWFDDTILKNNSETILLMAHRVLKSGLKPKAAICCCWESGMCLTFLLALPQVHVILALLMLYQGHMTLDTSPARL